MKAEVIIRISVNDEGELTIKKEETTGTDAEDCEEVNTLALLMMKAATMCLKSEDITSFKINGDEKVGR